MPFVVIIMGSKSDWQVMQECIKILEQFQIQYEVYVSSAHRTPIRTKEIVIDSQKRGAEAFVGAAGMAAHLAGAIAATTLKPVIAVPLAGGMLDGLDSLLSSVQMPQAMPVATMSLGKAGAINAAYFVAQIFASMPQYPNLTEQLEADRQKRAKQLEDDTEFIRQGLNTKISG